jgi:hypothetical protein
VGDTPEQNLLVALHRWATRQDENFVTEAFAHLLRHLLENERPIGVDLLCYLTNNRLNVKGDEVESVAVSTQVTTFLGRPDITIRTSNHLVYVEVKVESDLGDKQLTRYRQALAESGFENWTLVSLIRHPASTEGNGGEPYVSRRWYEIADKLGKSLNGSHSWANPASEFLARQFVEFLQARGMTMERVNWELKRGVEALWSLILMLGEQAKKAGPEKTIAWDWIGYYIKSKKAWVGVRWRDPTLLVFATERLSFERSAAERLDYGEIQEYGGSPCGLRWAQKMDLESEEVHFFALSKATQIQKVAEFLQRGLEALSTLDRTHGQ